MLGNLVRHFIVGSTFALAASLAACSGGGSAAAPQAPIVPPAPSPSLTPVASPAPTPVPLTAQGAVWDLGAQRYANDGGTPGGAIAGATVIVGPVLITGATPPPVLPAGDAQATTAASGSYAVSGYAVGNPTYVMVFPAAGDSHVSLHGRATITNGQMRALYLYAPNANERAELAQVNADRSLNGVGAVIFDEIALETARAHADFMASNGYYAHCIPMSNCAPGIGTPPTSFPPQYASPNDLYNYLSGALLLAPGANYTENIAGNVVSWSAADALFMAEKGTARTGHYDQIVYPTHRWVGIGDNQAPQPPASFGLYVQEFY